MSRLTNVLCQIISGVIMFYLLEYPSITFKSVKLNNLRHEGSPGKSDFKLLVELQVDLFFFNPNDDAAANIKETNLEIL